MEGVDEADCRVDEAEAKCEEKEGLGGSWEQRNRLCLPGLQMNHAIALFEELFEPVGLHLELCEVVLLLHAFVAEEIEVLQSGSLRFVIEELKKYEEASESPTSAWRIGTKLASTTITTLGFQRTKGFGKEPALAAEQRTTRRFGKIAEREKRKGNLRGSSMELFRSLSISVIRWNVSQFARQVGSSCPSRRRRTFARSLPSREESVFSSNARFKMRRRERRQ